MKVTLLALMVATLICVGARAADRLDRVLAVVDGTVITESDVRASIRFGLVDPAPTGADPIRTTLDQLIRRELILREVARTTSAESDSARVSAAIASIRARFDSADAFQTRLAETAMDETRLRDTVSANILVDDYLNQRFGAVAEPGDAEIAAAYEARRAEFTIAGRPMTLEEAKPAVRQRLMDERRRQIVDDWVGRLRRRAEVTDLYFAGGLR
jgi:hypothetical protein